MERKIGEIFEVNCKWYQCLESSSCRCGHCDYDEIGDCDKIACTSGERSDNKEVYFKKLEKVGDPYEKRVSDDTFSKFQRYKVYNSVVLPKEPYIYCNFIDGTVEIEIKQTKEDMGKYKMHDAKEDILEFDKVVDECLFGEDKPNLKSFDLEAAKAGKPVYTRDGRKARIICFDAKCPDEQILIVLVDCGKEESIYFYTTDGKCIEDFSSFDLMMLPEKKEGWANVYKDSVYDSKEAALAGKSESRGYIDTIKVSWEE